ncbi:hypothetical protein [Frankia sp. EAN1pec]|uniref:hypothetical protein n=1 Tax=Parafrankia sp. (strain EAN1pec) TaxID=298653 RepID=UPI00030AD516
MTGHGGGPGRRRDGRCAGSGRPPACPATFAVFAAEAEIRWLDHVESRLARAAATRTRSDDAAPGGASGGERPGAVTEARR